MEVTLKSYTRRLRNTEAPLQTSSYTKAVLLAGCRLWSDGITYAVILVYVRSDLLRGVDSRLRLAIHAIVRCYEQVPRRDKLIAMNGNVELRRSDVRTLL